VKSPPERAKCDSDPRLELKELLHYQGLHRWHKPWVRDSLKC
jgi:hypothetical protein